MGGRPAPQRRGGGPTFERPPITELAIGIQFRSLAGIRAINLAPLRAGWQSEYPSIEELPPLMPAIEGAEPTQINFQVSLGPMFSQRFWFVSDSGEELVQLQADRLIVNWRKLNPDSIYPRYEHIRASFAKRLDELVAFLESERLGAVAVTQADVSYINMIDIEDNRSGLERIVQFWSAVPQHHLGAPSEARAAVSFEVERLGKPPARLHLTVDPARTPEGRASVFMTLTVRGAPADDSIQQALEFLDGAHEHATQSFVELTTEEMHKRWGLVQ